MTTSAAIDPSPKNAQVDQDGLCFTAGIVGAPFFAGVIHAYLTADRPAPLIAAGISTGALSAAVVQRCFDELNEAKAQNRTKDEIEAKRWAFLQKYLRFMTESPLNVIWDGIPNQSDFFADLPPVKDSSVTTFASQEKVYKKGNRLLTPAEYFEEEELQARKRLFLLVKLGNWLAGLPIRVSSIADLTVSYIRAREKYDSPSWLRKLAEARWGTQILFQLIFYIARAPKFLSLQKFRRLPPHASTWDRGGWQISYLASYAPLFGWDIWLGCTAFLLSSVYLLLILITRYGNDTVEWLLTALGGSWLFPVLSGYIQWETVVQHSPLFRFITQCPPVRFFKAHQSSLITFSASYLLFFAMAAFWQLSPEYRNSEAVGKMFKRLGLRRSLIHRFHLRVALTKLFGTDGVSPKVDPKGTSVALVLVAASLQKPKSEAGNNPLQQEQFWAGPDTSLVDALAASLAIPGVFEPVKCDLTNDWRRDQWQAGVQLKPMRIDLVDGAVTRQNPLPSLFQYLFSHETDQTEKRNLAEALSSRTMSGWGPAKLHVVYSVPIQENLAASELPIQQRINVVDVALASLQMSRRRDVKFEVLQTQFMSSLELLRWRLQNTTSTKRFPIFVDEVAPDSTIRFRNPLSPDRAEVMAMMAHGCQKTLQELYRPTIRQIAEEQSKNEGTGLAKSIECSHLLKLIAPQRAGSLSRTKCSGLPEVCGSCSQKLSVPELAERQPGKPPDRIFRCEDPAADEKCRRLEKVILSKKPRIVLITSGGVFRGSFHIGMLAALRAMNVKPDLIVGASVGTLMGGVMGVMFSVGPWLSVLDNLVATFLRVDERVAFTKVLKSATRELGVRARQVKLSCGEVRRMILRGARKDPGFAATSAPPALIDAISTLFLLPHENTRRIASQFVAGHVTKSVNLLIQQLRKETLRKLDIESALMGTSLLEPVARELLGSSFGVDLKTDQPFLKNDIAFFATTSELNQQSSVVLGTKAWPSYDFVYTTLASSAFPAVFAPVCQDLVYPGAGRGDVYYSDGGMFDNLPFFPAVRILSELQTAFWKNKTQQEALNALRDRQNVPDLFIAGSLDSDPDPSEEHFEGIVDIRRRAGELERNIKIKKFQEAGSIINDQIADLIAACDATKTTPDLSFLNHIVNTSVLPIYPSDAEHLNGTFQFCRSLGLKQNRVIRSIADGCFKTRAEFARLLEPSCSDNHLARRALSKLRDESRIPVVAWAPTKKEPSDYNCPFFLQDSKPVECPFAKLPSSAQVFKVCRSDNAHVSLQKENERTKQHEKLPPQTDKSKAAASGAA